MKLLPVRLGIAFLAFLTLGSSALSAYAQGMAPAETAAPGPTPVTDSSVPQTPTDTPATTAAAAAVPVPPPAPAPPQPKFGLPAKPASVVEQDFIGHRYSEPEDTGGWGWVKLPEQSWRKARWVTLRETPGIAVAPWRTNPAANGKRDGDQNFEYHLHGYFAPYRVYDPHTDEMLEVLIVDSVTPIEGASPAKPLDNTPGPAEREVHKVRSSFRSRDF